MGLFNKQATQPEPTPDGTASDKVSMVKGQRVNLDKNNFPVITTNGWKARGKDYDLYVVVRYHTGRTLYVGAADSSMKLVSPEGAVRHGGDVTKGSGELEKVTVTWHRDIASVAFASYSAIKNGPGSFQEYGVYVNINHGPKDYGIAAADTSAHRNSYTCFFGEVIFNEDGSFSILSDEQYSDGKERSEKRIAYKGSKVVMDAGPEGRTK